ncbi:hypothetical protein POVCU2_0028850 [Plasmodium ovale curtisi]|uniref:Uncharacterized protein n=1 Tax=Plasmodium ovale curtisi TaxID=864141 RepID=A0A1A8W1C4_PLAOA|nr:hypothetical protein POVCU2_0028850 [Plasmodium ovale curtisi]
MNIQDRKSRDAEKFDYVKIEKKNNNQSNILKNKIDTNDKVNKCKRNDNERGYTFESLNGSPKNDRSTLKKKSHHLKISNNASTSRNSTHVNEDNYKSANSCTAIDESDNVSNCKERHTNCALTSASEGDKGNSNSNSCYRNDKRGRYLQNGEKFEDKNSSNSEQKNARESHRSASLDNICERASSHKLKGNHENWSGNNMNYLDKVLQSKLKKKPSSTFLSSNVINSDESKNCYDNNSSQNFQDICKMTYDKMEKEKIANNYTRGINTESKKKITKLRTDANNKEDSSSKNNNYLLNGGSDSNDNESSGSSTENNRDNCAVRENRNIGKLALRKLRKKGEIIRYSYLSKIKYEKGKKKEEKRGEDDGKHAHVKSRRAKEAHDISNQQTTTHVRSDSTCSNMKIILFKRTDDRKDKYSKNDKARNNNLGHNQNSNYKKFSLYNSSRNNVPLKKEYRGNNENNGDSDERYNNYINRGSIKKIEYTKNSYRYKNNDPSLDCDNYKSNKYYMRGKNYKGDHAYKSGEGYHYRERYKSENNCNDKNKDLYKGNVKKYKNNSGKICWNAPNSSSKNGHNNSKYNTVLKVHDYSQNVDNYNTKNRRNNYHSGSSSSRSRNYHTDNDEEGEHYEESDYNYSYGTHNFYVNRYRETRFYRNNKQYQVQDDQSERDEFFNFKNKHLKNKMDLSNIKRRDKRFNNGEKYEKKNNSNNKEKQNAFKNNANINFYKGKSINNEEVVHYEENKARNSTIEGSYQSVDYHIEKRLQNESCNVTSFARNNHVVRNTFGEGPASDSFDDSANQCSVGTTNNIDDIMHSSVYHKRTHSSSAYRGIYYNNSESVKNDVNENTDSDIANCNAYNSHSYHFNNDIIKFSSRKTNSSAGFHIEINNSDIEYGTNGGKGGNNSEDRSKRKKTKGIQNDIKKDGQMIKCDYLNDQFYHIEMKDHCEEEKNNTVVKNEEDRGSNFFSTINSFKHLKNSNDDFSIKTDEKSSAENPSCSNFKEFQIWIGNRYNALLGDYIDQEKRKKNNNEVFEDEIKMYEYDDTVHINETLEKGTNERVTFISRDNSNFTNPNGSNERNGINKNKNFDILNKNDHVDNVVNENYNTTKSSSLLSSKSSFHALYYEENKYPNKNNDQPSNNQKRLSTLSIHKNGSNNKDSFLSHMSNTKFDKSRKADEVNTNSNFVMRKNNITYKNIKKGGKLNNHNFSKKRHYEKKTDKQIGSNNLTSKRINNRNNNYKNKTSNNVFYKEKYPDSEQGGGEVV